MYLDLLDRDKGALTVLLYISRNEEVGFSRLVDEIEMSRQRCHTTIQNLIRVGLVFTTREKGWPSRIHYKLTQRGLEVAGRLHEINAVLEDTIEGCKRQLLKLEKEAKSGKKGQRRKIQIMTRLLSECFKSGNWDDVINHGKDLIILCKNHGDYEGLANAERTMGAIYQRRQEYEEAAKYFRKSLKACHKMNDQKNIALDNYHLGTIFERQGKFKKALEMYRECEKYSKKCGSEIDQARAFLGEGRILSKKGLHKDAAKLMKKAVNIFEKLDHKDELPKAYANLGSTTFFIHIDEALKWHLKCIEISELEGDQRMLGYGLSNVAGCYIEKKELKKAKRYLERAMPIFKALDEKVMVLSALTHYARICRAKNQSSKAKEYLQEALRIAKSIKTPLQSAYVYFQLGLVSKDIGNENRARRYLNSAMRIYTNMGITDMIEDVNRELNELTPQTNLHRPRASLAGGK
ncbi:tetratricopeptide repeat protein [Candidatus Pacearchaeota archaeon]|nr:tetratricopeptide repeat protein [Candidatus Pacearchaeota archaeon]